MLTWRVHVEGYTVHIYVTVQGHVRPRGRGTSDLGTGEQLQARVDRETGVIISGAQASARATRAARVAYFRGGNLVAVARCDARKHKLLPRPFPHE